MRKVNLQKIKPRSGAVRSELSAYRYERSQSFIKAEKQADAVTNLPSNQVAARKSSESDVKIAYCDVCASLPKRTGKPEIKTEVITTASSFEKKEDQNIISQNSSLNAAKGIPANNEVLTQAAENGVNLLYQIYRISARAMDLEKFIRQTCAILSSELHIDALLAYLYDDVTDRIRRYHCVGMDMSKKDDEYVFPDALIEQMMRKRRGSDKNTRNYIELNQEQMIELFYDYADIQLFGSAIVFPIFFDETLLGCLAVFLRENEVFAQQTEKIMMAVCAQLSALVQNIRLYNTLTGELEEHKRAEEQLKKVNEELENSAYTDHLTGLWNRRGLIKHVYEQMELMREQKNSLSFLLLDIDHFKKVNDKYGHQVGDMVLVDFADLLRANSRTTDSITRWGGEEFLILTTTNIGNTAYTYAERLRKLVSIHAFPVIGEMTVSIGVAELREGEDFDSWIKRVDDALYAAKDRDRNNVVICRDEE